MRSTRIVIFAKAPTPGKVKTRLIPILGAEGAAGLAEEMLRATLAEAKATELPVELCASPAPASAEWLGHLRGVSVSDQGDGDLGVRLARAAERVVGEGENILLIGTDCPELTSRRLLAAAYALRTHDAFLYPAHDGGYALLGLARYDRSIFDGIAWSSGSVAAETIGRVKTLGWSLEVRETLHDIDEPEDLKHLSADG